MNIIIFALTDYFLHPSEHKETGQTAQFENFLNRPTTMLNFDFKRNPHCIKTQELQMKRALLIIS